VLVESPFYDPIPAAARMLGGRVAYFPRRLEDGFDVDPGIVAGALTRRTRLLVLTNPHNPSGTLVSPDRLQELMELWRFRSPWMFDEFDRIEEIFPPASYQYVLYGMGYDTAYLEDDLAGEAQKASKLMGDNHRIARQLCGQLPRHRELLRKIDQHGLQRI